MKEILLKQTATRRQFLQLSPSAVAAGLLTLTHAEAPTPWKPDWQWEVDWPQGPQGERQGVTLTIGPNELLALSNGYTKVTDAAGNTHTYEASGNNHVIIPIIDGGETGGTFNLELNNIFNWKGVAKKPQTGRSLNAQELAIIHLDLIGSARDLNGATEATFLWIDASSSNLLVGDQTVKDVDFYLKSLKQQIASTGQQVFLPQAPR